MGGACGCASYTLAATQIRWMNWWGFLEGLAYRRILISILNTLVVINRLLSAILQLHVSNVLGRQSLKLSKPAPRSSLVLKFLKFLK
jgi:hypothetical protein